MKLRGFGPDEVVHQSMKDVITPESYTRISELLPKRLAAFASGDESVRVMTLAIDQVCKDGSTVPTEVVTTLLTDPDGKATTILGVSRDITERKQAEEALTESEEKFREIFNSANDGIHLHEVDEKGLPGKYIVVNEVVCRMLQYSREELLEMGPADISTDNHNPPIEQIGQELLKTGHVVFETGHCRKDGTIIPLEVNAHIITIKGKKMALSVARDITGRKQAEKELREANKKLNLLSGITRHDINNQLTLLRGYLSLLEETSPDPSQNEFFQKATTAAERISTMIQFTKEYESIGVKAPAWLEVRPLVHLAAKEAPLGNVTVNNDLPAGLEVFGDQLIGKVFYNLMDNAVRYGGKISTVRFSVQESYDDTIIVCEDDGVGVPAGEKEQVFEPGFGKNTGLGLALSREILDITGITIREMGEPGKGARFEMTVPKGAWRMV